MSIYGGNVLKGMVSGGQGLSGSAEKINVIKGESAYQLAVLNGFEGTEAEWLESLHGRDGKSAYEYAKEKGYDGTEEEFAEMLANAGSGGGGGIIEETDPTVPNWAKQPQKPKYDATEITFIQPDSQSVLPSGTVDDALGEIDLFLRGVPSWALNPAKPNYTASEVGALPATTKIPTKTSDLENDSEYVQLDDLSPYAKKKDIPSVPTKVSELTNDSGFITKAVSDLTNYYLKSETLTKTEINALVSAIPKFTISVVTSLPTSNISTTTVYLVKSGTGGDLYTEYIRVNNAWEVLGSQKVDLTGYAKLDDIPAPEVYVGDGVMPDGATVQFILDDDDIPGVDIQEIVDAVLAALPRAEGVGF